MDKFQLREGADVFTPRDEQVGKVTGFVLDPATNEVTHIVVQKGWLLLEDKVVPFEMVNSATEDRVVLNEGISSFEELPSFEETHFLRTRETNMPTAGESTHHREVDDISPATEISRETSVDADVNEVDRPSSTYAPSYYWYPPQGYIGYPIGYYGLPPMETVRNIPEDTVPLKEGTDIISSDGEHVGDVERLFVEPGSNKATHFVISQGVFFKDRKLVPAHWVRSIDEDTIQLSVTAQVLEQLPSYEE